MIGERLTVARARKRMSMRDLGKIMGVSAQMILKYEHDKSMPGSRALLDACEALDCSVEWMLCQDPLDFESTETAPQGRHAKYWVREALSEMRSEGLVVYLGERP